MGNGVALLPAITVKVHMAALTHKGRVRDHNEDALYADERDRVLIVCDGMGGHAGGHIASELAVQVVSNGLRQLRAADWNDVDLLPALILRESLNHQEQLARLAANIRGGYVLDVLEDFDRQVSVLLCELFVPVSNGSFGNVLVIRKILGAPLECFEVLVTRAAVHRAPR